MTGELKCECDDGWVLHDGNCYQYSTQAWCSQGEILQVKLSLQMSKTKM